MENRIIKFRGKNIHTGEWLYGDYHREGKKYDIGLFFGVRVCNDPPDMFFAKYLRLGFADDFSMETIIKLAKQRIKKL